MFGGRLLHPQLEDVPVCREKRDINTYLVFFLGLEVNAEETKHMLMSRHHNVGQNHNIKATKYHLKMWQN
jgi:hypothetical protein